MSVDDPDPEVRRQALIEYFQASAERSAAAAAAVREQDEQRRRGWQAAHPTQKRLSRVARRFGSAVEVLLYVLFIVDCFILLAGVAAHPSYEPVGGGSLIVILLAIGVIRFLRGADD